MSVITWIDFKIEAENIARREELLAPFIKDAILDHNSFEESICALLSISFSASGVLPFATWQQIFRAAFLTVGNARCKYDGQYLADVLIADLTAIKTRDPACRSIVNAYLNFKGFKALQAHRAAHMLWYACRRDVSLAIQARAAELWSVDIHPAAHIGPGLMIDHGTGVVIGETAVVGRDCSFLHGVTLGATGKDTGDRHPKIGDGVLIGCNAIVLGNITVGNQSKIGSGSVVIKPVSDHDTVVGNPARSIGKTMETTTPAAEMDLGLKSVAMPSGCLWIDYI